MSEFLFKEFDGVSAKQWKQKIQYDLKGADYNETLVWQSPEGVNVKPFYHSDDFPTGFQKIPGQPDSWKIAQEVFIDDEAIANNIALDALNRGAESIVFKADAEFDTEKVLKDFPFERSPIYFEFGFLSEGFLGSLMTFLQNQKATVYYNIDIIGKLARTGNWFLNEKTDFQILTDLVQKQTTANILGVDVSLYQNAGANIVQQLAYALAHANEYFNLVSSTPLGDRDRSNSGAEGDLKIAFKLSVGSNYFFEIAKIRALRKLYSIVAKEYGFSQTCHIIAVPSERNKTLYDYNVNMLRTTTECMSAILGGADAVCNLAYDGIYHKSNEFGERIARNQLLILKNESYFDKVSNPSDGTYYIESLTDELATKALVVFKDIEKGGGFMKQLKEGIVQKKIKESAEKEQTLFNNGGLKLLGTNYHQNKRDRMKENLELFPFVKHNPVKTLIAPIIANRLSEITEQERLKQES
ncbi:methylmalonyl-CoA mutase [Aequorivita sp. H23M31]|uniref:Methylmalonyl-CoA mutase n=1 Tax=Aequorivita ciconiae TaxID=2494375 RepID=A0A410G772_9FLAO|nr:methylmalonyl-CoA mutase subunit beta [Aequorivita sp. H23M31]QAA83112.1 methylmalonyl-CoA mutase [Aequorivita sp. H23M31]